jgi:hypothetical protein
MSLVSIPTGGSSTVASGGATDITGLLKGAGSVLSAAVAGTDYIAPSTAATLKNIILASPAANTGFLAATGLAITESSTVGMVSLAGTLNTSGVVDLIGLDFTNTLSGTGTNLINLKMDGTSRFRVEKNNQVHLASNSGLWFTGTRYQNGVYATGIADIYFYSNSQQMLFIDGAGAGFFRMFPSQDVVLARGGAASLQLGQNHASAATNQTIKAHNVTAGTGASLTLQGGTGTVANGAVVLNGGNRAAYDAAPSTTVIRDILISHGLMAAS